MFVFVLLGNLVGVYVSFYVYVVLLLVWLCGLLFDFIDVIFVGVIVFIDLLLGCCLVCV